MSLEPRRPRHAEVAPRAAAAIAVIAGPWGPVHAAATQGGIVAIALLTTRSEFLGALERTVDPRTPASDAPAAAGDHLDRLAHELGAYFSGSLQRFSVAIDLRVRTTWDLRVLHAVRDIPYGRIATYGEVAARIGSFGAARAVGGAVGRNPIAIVVPCHRVIAAGGVLGGYGGTRDGSREQRLAFKRDPLRLEGVVHWDRPDGETDRRQAAPARLPGSA
jgi:methylated-DNA-[protein]-cysteine S-methyltransferase